MYWPNDPDLEDFRRQVEKVTNPADYPLATEIIKNIPVYDAAGLPDTVSLEWIRVLLQGPGVLAIRGAFSDTATLDAATTHFRDIIAEERAAGAGAGDHFAAAGANDRVWNSLQKLCLRAPEVYVNYMANPVLAQICTAWLGDGYQIATQLNVVRPGGKAQISHRDYHLGFMKSDQMQQYAPHIHQFGPMMILQGGVAHCDMPEASGTTKLLPWSQTYLPGYIATLRPEFRAYFEENYVQLPLKKGDCVFFSPALFHAAGENKTADVERMVNLLQVASVFVRHMETLDRAAMSRAVYPYLPALPAEDRARVIAATADGYPFPTNLDTDPPVGGLAPESQQELLARAVAEAMTADQLAAALEAQSAKRVACPAATGPDHRPVAW